MSDKLSWKQFKDFVEEEMKEKGLAENFPIDSINITGYDKLYDKYCSHLKVTFTLNGLNISNGHNE